MLSSWLKGEGMSAEAMIARAKEIRARLMFPPNGRHSSELDVVSEAELRRRRLTVGRAAPPLRRETWPVTVAIGRRRDGPPIRTHLRASTMKRLCRAVAQHYRVTESELLSECHEGQVVRARQVLCHLARGLTSLSSTQIGAALNRDHTTVLHACRKIARALATDSALAADVKAIRRMIAADAG
jgi:hypothetical protein